MIDGAYESIREALPIAGHTVVDVTCDDWEEVCAEYPDAEDRKITRVYVHFEDGSTLTFFTHKDSGFRYDGYPEAEVE